ncbi:ectonucleotide pyrophosphatase/phosphodiesterase family member 5-like [Episyrphus balteatus]|uniref:ectonucleotide pyrophosphatase/phosphodiesterase family member 5-like n=1 Tax=Episyrphus balteatus TaxID=286459 RepID=UPI00248656C7|nr:ectonucleotide pyrophosphatase/phosphodiesterase family member 5-like [Episyrphus balteatus]
MKLNYNGSVITFLVSALQCVALSSSAATTTTHNNRTLLAKDDQSQTEKPILIIVSYDGFRNEYLKRNVTPNLLKFRSEGIYTDRMLNVFPTKTFTNHFSMATGLYPDKHGILANSLYDTKEGPLAYSYKLFHYDESIEPIWIVNEKANGHSGCMMWPGSDFNYTNKGCTHMLKYDRTVPLMDRVDTMMKWLTDPIKPANLVMFYSEQPDKLAHIVGPDTQNITDVVASLDLLTKYIQEQIIAHKLQKRVNLIHLSDHGMAGVPTTRFINLTDYLEPDSCKMYGTSPILQIVPSEGKLDYVYETLKNASIVEGHFDVYKSKELLKRWHATNEQRFGPIIAVAKMDYAFQDLWEWAKNDGTAYGVHGYDNEEELMHPIFMAKGPAFKAGGQEVKPFESVDLFYLFTKILGINDTSIRDGSAARISHLFATETVETSHTTTIVLVSACGLAIIAGIAFYVMRVQKRRNTYSPT